MRLLLLSAYSVEYICIEPHTDTKTLIRSHEHRHIHREACTEKERERGGGEGKSGGGGGGGWRNHTFTGNSHLGSEPAQGA